MNVFNSCEKVYNFFWINLKYILYINLLISSLKILFILSIWVSLYNLCTLVLNLLNVIILNNLLFNNIQGRDDTGQHLCSPAHPELTKNRPARLC